MSFLLKIFIIINNDYFLKKKRKIRKTLKNIRNEWNCLVWWHPVKFLACTRNQWETSTCEAQQIPCSYNQPFACFEIQKLRDQKNLKTWIRWWTLAEGESREICASPNQAQQNLGDVQERTRFVLDCWWDRSVLRSQRLGETHW